MSDVVSNQLSIKLNTQPRQCQYNIEIKSGLVAASPALQSITSQRSVFIISNSTVADLYLEPLQKQLEQPAPVYLMPDGEQFKNLQQFEKITAQMMQRNFGRDGLIIALGGGVVGDLAGFVAACYQRGIEFVQVPTTLLAQIDASVGGKTAVNHTLGKNMIGAFHQPSLVIIDPDTLLSLEQREFNAGLGEAVKYGLMADADLFDWIEDNAKALKQRDQIALQHLITRCCEIKAEIVTADEKEQGIRALLNLGHTFAHAFEAETEYQTYLHGEAVAIGLIAAMQLSIALKKTSLETKPRLTKLLEFFDLPISVPTTMDPRSLIGHMLKDKKNREGKIHFVVNTGKGSAEVMPVDDHDIIIASIPYS